MEDSNPLKKLDSKDAFLHQHQPSDIRLVSEILTTWLPFLSKDLCPSCIQTLSHRITSLRKGSDNEAETIAHLTRGIASLTQWDVELHDDSCNHNNNGLTGSVKDGDSMNSLESRKDVVNRRSGLIMEASVKVVLAAPPSVETPGARTSWADMAQEDELDEEDDQHETEQQSISKGDLNVVVVKPTLSRDQREYIRFMNVSRKKDFKHWERIRGKSVNILEGLELHTGVFSATEQKRIVNCVYELEEKGRRGQLRDRTYTAPQKWMRGKGRVTIQFGCCYNYAVDKDGNPPGILQNKLVDPIPPLFKVIIKRLVKWHVIPTSCVPDSCIVNIYEEGDCIPPHIDNHDFIRPFCTVSFLSQCNIVFGTSLKVLGPGDFAGSYAIPLPVGSVLVLNGNGADVAKHCVPSVPTKRISITFRKMDEAKQPNGFVQEPDLQGIQPLRYKVDKIDHVNTLRSEDNTKRYLPAGEVILDSKRENGSRSEPSDLNRVRQGPINKWRR